MLTFSSGGWVLLLAGVLTLVMAAALLWPALGGGRAIGDGVDPASYGFDLSNLRFPRDLLVAGGIPKDGLPALVEPPCGDGRTLAPDKPLNGVRLLRANDRVVGLFTQGEARAYPLWILTWHEVVNDTIGGRPVAITFSPLADAVVVFDRRIGGETRTFGVSGLLYNSMLVMYDRRDDHAAESLWSPLALGAIAGPAAANGLRLEPLHHELTTWGEWQLRYGATRVLMPDPARKRVYKREAYSSYLGSDELRFPVAPLPSAAERPLKTPLLAARVNHGEWTAWTLPLIAERVDANGVWRTTVDDAPLTIRYRPEPPTAWIEAADAPAGLSNVHAFWFAWHAFHPETTLE
ncbi:MAG: DUF3179 domain-containing (seleno)protein [Phycisphaerae bacterium]